MANKTPSLTPLKMEDVAENLWTLGVEKMTGRPIYITDPSE